MKLDRGRNDDISDSGCDDVTWYLRLKGKMKRGIRNGECNIEECLLWMDEWIDEKTNDHVDRIVDTKRNAQKLTKRSSSAENFTEYNQADTKDHSSRIIGVSG